MKRIFNWIISKLAKPKFRSPEFGSELVRLSCKISSVTSKTQIIKIANKYFKVKELG